MPSTPRGIFYPESTASSEIWVHMQSQATTADTAIGAAAAATLSAAATAAAGLYGVQGHSDRYLAADTGNLTANLDIPIAYEAQVNSSGDPEAGATWNVPYRGLVVAEGGRWVVNAQAAFSSNSSGSRTLEMFVVTPSSIERLVASKSVTPDAGGTVCVALSKTLKVADGERIEIRATTSHSAGTVYVRGGSHRLTYFDAVRVAN